MATRKRVETKLKEMIARLEGSGEDVHANLARALPDERTVAIEVTDLDCTYWSRLSGGRMSPLRPGAPDDANITLRASSDDLVAMIDGELGLLKSYLSGRVRIDASFSDLLALRKMA